jgi:subtilisin family serine protease
MIKKSFTFATGLIFLASVFAVANLHSKELHLKAGHLQLNNPAMMTKSMETHTDYYIVQFKNKLKYSDREALEKLGAKFKSYIPEDALLVEMSPMVNISVKEEMGKSILKVIPYLPEFKVSPSIRPSVFNATEQIAIVVRAASDEDAQNVIQSISSVDETRIEDVDGKMLYVVTQNAKIYDIAKVDGVEWIEELPEFQTAYLDVNAADNKQSDKARTSGDYSDLTGYESGTELMNFGYAWGRGLTGQGQIVAMADTGLDTGTIGSLHPDFNSNVVKGYAEGLFSKSWADPQGHGTHVAGSVMGSGAASGGRIVGGGYGAQMVAQGMWSKMMNNIMVPPKLGEMFARPYSDGARVHTNSWGSPQNLGAYSNFSAMVDEFMWNNPDMLVIFAAGNSGQDANADGRIDEDSISAPGTAKNVLTVGASENWEEKGGIQRTLKELRNGASKWGAEPIASDKLSNNPNGIAAFSSRGPTDDGRIKPDVVAPGTNILSARSRDPQAGTLWGAYNDHYVWAGGTSMATPLTAGAAVVLRQYLEQMRSVRNPSAAMLKAAIVHTATDLFPGQFGTGPAQELPTRRPNVHEGYGRVDLAKQVLLDYAYLEDNKRGLAEGKVKYVEFSVARKANLITTLAYTDAPAAASATKALVNDLDLEIYNEAGKLVYTKNDNVNNLEMIEGRLEPGKYRVAVKAKRIVNGKSGKQPYALIIGYY